MSLTADEVLNPPAAQTGTVRSALLSRAPVYFGLTLLALVSNYISGKEASWDSLNYHLYLGFSALHDRFDEDYFAAGLQGYFNPYAYVPFYSMVRTGLPALAISSILAIAHSVILWLTFELGVLVCPVRDRGTRLLYGLCAAALAFLNPIVVQQIGSSYADITTATLALGGWLLLARTVFEPRTWQVLCAGLLLGAACALKPTNAVHALAAPAMLLLLPRSLAEKLRAGIGYLGTLLLGFAFVSAPWAYRLELSLGNPVFPLLNNLFRSPELTVESLRQLRFIPSGFGEALWRPFATVAPGALVHEELSAPDIRYAVLLALLAAWLIKWLRTRRQSQPAGTIPRDSRPESRVVASLCLGLATDWTLWLGASGNGRYFLPMGCVAAVLVVAFAFALFESRPKARNYFLAAILTVQGLQVWEGSDHRWREAAWGGTWFNVEMPQRLASEPNLYLSIGVQSNSFLVPFLAAGSGFVNFSGGYALSSEGAGGKRIEDLIRHHDPHLRMLASGAHVYADNDRRAPARSQIDGALQRLGLRVDPTDCATIAIRGVPADLEITFKSQRVPEPTTAIPDTAFVVSCRVVHDVTGQAEFLARQRAVDVVFDRLEDACPELFRPRRIQTEHPGTTMWLRSYPVTDLIAWVDHGQVESRDLIHGGGKIEHLGRESDWAEGPRSLVCGRQRDGSFFVRTSPRSPTTCAPEAHTCR